MRELSKPNDIFVATSSGDVSLEDLYANNITGDNTSFYTMDEYKMTPFVKKKYTKDGVFDEFTFEQDYIRASEMFKALTDEKAEKEFIQKELYYDPQSLNAPLGAQRLDPRAVYTKFRNPLEQAVGHEQINTWSDPEKTPEELAQGNKIFDPKTGQFLDVTAETRNIWDKTAGRTLKYAIWETDGTHIDAETGELVNHYAGDWKTDKDGRYYTEIMYDEQLGNAQVVSLADTLTKEGSALNKIDFFDSDGYTKSIAGTVFKTAANIAPYLIPGFNKIYGGVVAATNLAKVLPTFYKSIDSMFLGDNHTKLYDNATEMENWFSKFNSSKSYEGRKGFWTLENFGQLASDTFSQLYQQRAVASLSKYLKPVVENESKAVTLSRNALGRNLSLGYMALTSSADMYNEAKNAGYSDRAAGIVSLASAGAMFGIMNANEAGKGMTSWFLDKTDGVDKTIEPHYFRKLLLKENGILDDVAKIEENFINGNVTGVKKWLNPFKKKLLRWQHELEGATAGMWKNAYIEGLEEVSEEAIQDFVKGAADTLAWLGIWKNDTEGFGGWSNVFSKQGLDRYLSTFVGGAVGGAIFEAQNKWIEPAYNSKLREFKEYENNRDIIDVLVDGHKDELIKAAKSMRGYFNTDISAQLGTDSSGKALYIASSGGKTQADVIIDGVIQRIEEIDNALRQILPVYGDVDYTSKIYLDERPDKYIQDKNTVLDLFQKQHVNKKYVDKLAEVVNLQQQLDKLKEEDGKKSGSSASGSSEETKFLNEKLKKAIEEVQDFFNWKNTFHFSSQFALFANPNLREALSAGLENTALLDKSSYTWQKYKKDYNSLDPESNDPSAITKKTIDAEYEIYAKQLDLDELGKQLENLYNLYLAEMPIISDHLKDMLTEAQSKAIMQSITGDLAESLNIKQLEDESDEDFKERRLQELINVTRRMYEVDKISPKHFSLHDSVSVDLFKNEDLKNSLTIAFLDQNGKRLGKDSKRKEKQDIIAKLINQQIALYGNNEIWTLETFRKALETMSIQNSSKEKFNTPYNLTADNFYVGEYIQVLKEQGKELGLVEGELDAFIKNNLANNLDFTSWGASMGQSYVDILNAEKPIQILDAIAEQEYINDDLLEQLQLWHKATLIEISSRFKQLLNKASEEHEKILREMGYMSSYTLPKEITNAQVIQILNNLSKSPSEGYVDLSAEKIIPIELLTYLNGLAAISEDGQFEILLNNPVLKSIIEYQNKEASLIEKNKKLPKNPVYELLNNFLRKFNYNGKSLKLLEYLKRKEFEINSLKDLNSLDLTEGEMEECIKQMQICLTHLQGLIHGTGAYNSNLAAYAEKYIDSDYAKQFIVLNDEQRLVIQQQLDNVQDKITKLATLYSIQGSLKIKEEQETIEKIEKAQVQFLELKLEGVLPAKSKDADVPDDEFIFERETEIYNHFKEKSKEEKITFLKSFIDTYAEEGVFENDYSIKDIYDNPHGTIHKGFMLRRLMELMVAPPSFWAEEYNKALEDAENPILYKHSQRLAFNQMLASMLNDGAKEINKAVIEYAHTIQDKLVKSVEEDADKHFITGHEKYIQFTPLYNVNYISGIAGSGKTSVVSKLVLKALEKSGHTMYVAAPTTQKKDDLTSTLKYKNNFTVWGKDQLMSKILSPESLAQLEAFKEKVHKKLQEPLDIDAIKAAKAADGKSLNGYHVETVADEHGNTFEIFYALETKDEIDYIHHITYSCKLASLKPNITKDSKLSIYIDEATKLDPVTLQILNKLANSKDYSLNIILSGDSAQEGYSVPYKLDGYVSSESLTFNAHYLNQSPYLDTVFRSNNTAVTYNVNKVGKLSARYINKFKKEFTSKSTINDIKAVFSESPLIYNDTTFQGHQITSDKKEFFDQLVKTHEKAKSEDKKLYIVVDDSTKESELTEELSKLSIPSDSYIVFHQHSDIKHIQGAENEYVVAYDLKPVGSAINQLQSAYMLVSRAKNYMLIYDNGGLWSNLGLHSEFSDTILSESVDLSTIKQFTDKVIKRNKELIEKFKGATGSTSSKSSEEKKGKSTETGEGEDYDRKGEDDKTDTETGTEGEGDDGKGEEKDDGKETGTGKRIDSAPTGDEARKSSAGNEKARKLLAEHIKTDLNMFFVDTWFYYLGPEFSWKYDEGGKVIFNVIEPKGSERSGFYHWLERTEKETLANILSNPTSYTNTIINLARKYRKDILSSINVQKDDAIVIEQVYDAQCFDKPNDEKDNLSPYLYIIKKGNVKYYIGIVSGDAYIKSHFKTTNQETLKPAGAEPNTLESNISTREKIKQILRNKTEVKVQDHLLLAKWGGLVQGTAERHYYMKYRNPDNPLFMTIDKNQRYLTIEDLHKIGYKIPNLDQSLDDLKSDPNVFYTNNDADFDNFIKFFEESQMYKMSDVHKKEFKTFFKNKLWIKCTSDYSGIPCVFALSYRPDITDNIEALNIHNFLHVITEAFLGKDASLSKNIYNSKKEKLVPFKGTKEGVWYANSEYSETDRLACVQNIEDLIQKIKSSSDPYKDQIADLFNILKLKYEKVGSNTSDNVLNDIYNELPTEAKSGLETRYSAPVLSDNKLGQIIKEYLRRNPELMPYILNTLNPGVYLGPFPSTGEKIDTSKIVCEEYFEHPRYVCDLEQWSTIPKPPKKLSEIDKFKELCEKFPECRDIVYENDEQAKNEIIKILSPKNICDLNKFPFISDGITIWHNITLENDLKFSIVYDIDSKTWYYPDQEWNPQILPENITPPTLPAIDSIPKLFNAEFEVDSILTERSDINLITGIIQIPTSIITGNINPPEITSGMSAADIKRAYVDRNPLLKEFDAYVNYLANEAYNKLNPSDVELVTDANLPGKIIELIRASENDTLMRLIQSIQDATSINDIIDFLHQSIDENPSNVSDFEALLEEYNKNKNNYC